MWLNVAVILLLLGAAIDRDRHTRAHEDEPAYVDYGGSGEPLVLVPGLGGCGSLSDVVPLLTPQFRVVVFHLPLKTADNADDYSFRYIATRLASVLDELSIERCDVLGESFGGGVAQRFALDYGTRVRRLVLLSSFAKTTELTTVASLRKQFSLPIVRLVGLAYPGLAQTILAYVLESEFVHASEPKWVSSQFVKEFSWAHHYSAIARLDVFIPLDIVADVPRIHHQTLVVHGADDTFTGNASSELAAILPNARLEPIPGGHLAHLTSPRAFAELAATFLLQNTN